MTWEVDSIILRFLVKLLSSREEVGVGEFHFIWRYPIQLVGVRGDACVIQPYRLGRCEYRVFVWFLYGE
jgi:hypothetical protein